MLTLLQLEFLNTSLIGCDGGALDTDTILLDGLGSLHGDLVVGLITVFQTQIVVLEINVKVTGGKVLVGLDGAIVGGTDEWADLRQNQL